VFSQWRFFNTADNLTHVALLDPVKMPTGRTDRAAVKNGEGGREMYETHFQLGSGSRYGSLGVAFTQGLGNFSFDFNVLYTWVTKGARDVDLGDVFSYNAALSFGVPIVTDLNGYQVEPDYRITGRFNITF